MTRRQSRTVLIVSVTIAVVIGFCAWSVYRAGRGDAARDRQERAFPVVCKVVVAAESRGEVSARDLRTFLTDAPAPCPAVTPELAKRLRLSPRS